MANWVGKSRTNYFRVKDLDAFEAAMANFDVEIISHSRDSNRVGLIAETEDGDWPTHVEDQDPSDPDDEVDFIAEVASHLAHREVAVFQTIGAEKTRYLTGYAVAICATGERVRVDLTDIYARAQDAFGVTPGRAES